MLGELVAYVRRRRLPTTEALALDGADDVRRALDALVESGVVACFDEGPEAVYVIGPDQHLTAAYYRNTIIHFFVNGAIAELALVHAAERRLPDATAEFCEEALRLRDLLKFEFFFAEKDGVPRRARGRDRAARPRVAEALSRRRRRGRGAAAPHPAVQRAPRAAAVPRGLPRRRRRADAPAARRAARRGATSSRAASRSASSTSCSAASAAPSRCRRCSSRPRSAWRATAGWSTLPGKDLARTARACSPRRSATPSAASTRSTRSPPSRRAGLIV